MKLTVLDFSITLRSPCETNTRFAFFFFFFFPCFNMSSLNFPKQLRSSEISSASCFFFKGARGEREGGILF